MIDCTLEDAADALRGHIWFEYFRLTQTEQLPEDEVCTRFRLLFAEMTEMLQPEGLLRATIWPFESGDSGVDVQLDGHRPWPEFIEDPGTAGVPELYADTAAVDFNQLTLPPTKVSSWHQSPYFVRADKIHSSAVRICYELGHSLSGAADRVPLLAYMSTSFGSPKVVASFVTAAGSLATRFHFHLPRADVSPPILLETLTGLKDVSVLVTLMRRIWLSRLRQEYGRRCNERPRRADRVLDEFTDECYGYGLEAAALGIRDKRWSDCRRELKNNLCGGRVWERIELKYGMGGLALVCAGLRRTRSVERLRDKEIDAFMDSLEHRSAFLQNLSQQASQVLERLADHSVPFELRPTDPRRQFSYDSSDLIECLTVCGR